MMPTDQITDVSTISSDVVVSQPESTASVINGGLTQTQFDDLRKIKEKSEDDYEKNIIAIGSGTLALSLTFIEKIVPLYGSIAVWFLISSWTFLVVTLLVNLISHQLSSKFHDDCMQFYNTNIEEANQKVKYCNKIMRKLNWLTSITLILGIILLVLFCSINAYNMSKEKPQPPKAPSTEKLGRTISLPMPPQRGAVTTTVQTDNSNKNK